MQIVDGRIRGKVAPRGHAPRRDHCICPDAVSIIATSKGLAATDVSSVTI
jgi:hypothetical protein